MMIMILLPVARARRRALKRRGPPMDQPLHLAARAARLASLIQASLYALDRTAAHA